MEQLLKTNTEIEDHRLITPLSVSRSEHFLKNPQHFHIPRNHTEIKGSKKQKGIRWHRNWILCVILHHVTFSHDENLI
jgi:hypothetical protein